MVCRCYWIVWWSLAKGEYAAGVKLTGDSKRLCHYSSTPSPSCDPPDRSSNER